MKLVYKEDNALIYFHEKGKVLHLKWISFDCQKGYAQLVETLIRLTIELEVTAWLFDLKNCQMVRYRLVKTDLDYLLQNLRNTDLKKYARIPSKDPDYEVQVGERIEYFVKTFFPNLQIANFENETDALAWIFEPGSGNPLET